MVNLLLEKQEADISAFKMSPKQDSFSMPESPPVNRQVPSKLNKDCYSKNFPPDTLLRTLALDSISKDMALSPYWNRQCQELQSDLFLPHQIVLRDQASHSLNALLNYTEEASSFWRKTYLPKPLMCKHSLVFLPVFVIPKVENDHIEENACRKIRIYPEQPEKVDYQIDACRRAYNLCVAKYRAWKKGDCSVEFTELRRRVRELVQKESLKNGREVVSASLDEACQEAKRANQAVIRNRVRGKKSELQFRKKTATKQGFIYQKCATSGLPRILGDVYLTEDLPQESIKKQARLVREYGRYFLIVKKSIAIAAAKIQGNAVGIDPGVRTFATTYAPEQANKLGESFSWKILRPLGIKLDKLYSKRAKLFQRWKTLPNQLREDLLRCCERRINKLRQRRQDLIGDLHRRICYWLVTNYDFIFLPTFEVKQMTCREKRKIGSRTVRAMMDLCHYKFKQMLAWMCRKYGKTLIAVNESYTTRTQSWDGKQQEVNQTNSISDDSMIVDRDINGARGIFLRAITRELAP